MKHIKESAGGVYTHVNHRVANILKQKRIYDGLQRTVGVESPCKVCAKETERNKVQEAKAGADVSAK